MSQSNSTNTNDCWLWAMAVTKEDYGYTGSEYAHRLFYKIHNGAIPKGLEIDHLCFTPRCVNPEHLEAVTGRENLRREWERRILKCPAGHNKTGDNLYIEKLSGYKRCRICRTAANRKANKKRYAGA